MFKEYNPAAVLRGVVPLCYTCSNLWGSEREGVFLHQALHHLSPSSVVSNQGNLYVHTRIS